MFTSISLILMFGIFCRKFLQFRWFSVRTIWKHLNTYDNKKKSYLFDKWNQFEHKATFKTFEIPVLVRSPKLSLVSSSMSDGFDVRTV